MASKPLIGKACSPSSPDERGGVRPAIGAHANSGRSALDRRDGTAPRKSVATISLFKLSVDDTVRSTLATEGAEGKRLTYRRNAGNASLR
jgi:hypothetical protein